MGSGLRDRSPFFGKGGTVLQRKLLCALCVICALLSAATLAYPILANLLAVQSRSQVLTEYAEAVDDADEEALQEAWTAAQEYNAALSPVQFADNVSAALQAYDQLLNINGSGIMGYVDIPLIDVYLPIYHGTEADTLQNGIGHLAGSSLPVGGLGTHTVLTGHTGLASNRLFSDIKDMEIGDVFYLHVLSRTLAYKVTEINVVEPDDTSLLAINKEMDSCTLMTCTPTGINSHRLLVRGERTAYDGGAAEISEQARDEGTKAGFRLWLLLLPMAAALIAMSITVAWKKRKGSMGNKETLSETKTP